MRKIIDGMLFDTDNAKLIYQNEVSEDDTSNWIELYQTNSGMWFERSYNGIRPLTSENLRELLNDYLSDDEAFELYKKIFGEPEEA